MFWFGSRLRSIVSESHHHRQWQASCRLKIRVGTFWQFKVRTNCNYHQSKSCLRKDCIKMSIWHGTRGKACLSWLKWLQNVARSKCLLTCSCPDLNAPVFKAAMKLIWNNLLTQLWVYHNWWSIMISSLIAKMKGFYRISRGCRISLMSKKRNRRGRNWQLSIVK